MKPILRSIIFGFLGFIALISLLIGSYQVLNAGRIFPGVTVSGIDIGGLLPSQAAKLIGESITYPQTGKLNFEFSGQSWQVTPAQIGMFLDLDGSAQNAFLVGRTGNIIARLAEQFGSAYYGHPVSLSVIFDQRMAFNFLTELAKQIDVPAANAGVTIRGTEVIVANSMTGLRLDRETSLQAIASQINTLNDGAVPLTVIDIKPLIVDVGSQAEAARTLLSEPFNLVLPENQPDEQKTYTFNPRKWQACWLLAWVQIVKIRSIPSHWIR